eukprot:s3579_g6.t1
MTLFAASWWSFKPWQNQIPGEWIDWIDYSISICSHDSFHPVVQRQQRPLIAVCRCVPCQQSKKFELCCKALPTVLNMGVGNLHLEIC